MTISNFTDGELREELRRREAALPAPLESPNWSQLQQLVTNGIKKHAVGLKEHQFQHYVFQSAVSAVWGDEFWRWWNSHYDSDDLKAFE